MKGKFKQNVKSPKGYLLTVLNIIEIPTIPPSIILLGTKKHSKEKAANVAPIDITSKFFKNFIIKKLYTKF